jgi:hypothetical protein
MKSSDALPGLLGEIGKHRAVIDRMVGFYDGFVARHPDWRTLDIESSMGMAQFFGNFYTCAETIFFRISAFFENSLDKERWHSHLLDRMTCAIPGQRPAVIDDSTASALLEYLKFRHFTRYYFEFDYDREKLAYLGSRFPFAVKGLVHDMDRFTDFLEKLDAATD